MNTNKNKRLLWNLLYNKHYFNKFENNQFDEIKELFDNLIEKINNNNNNNTILEQNKLFIKEFIKELDTIKIPYKREDIITSRKQEILNNFNKKTVEFNEFEPVRPVEINFSDNIEETPIDLLDNISQLNMKSEIDLPLLKQISINIKTISNNQAKILEILNKLHINKNEQETTNLIMQKESNLIDINK